MAHLTPVEAADIAHLVVLENELFGCDRISRRQFRYLLTKANSVVVKAEKDGSLVAYMVLLKRKRSRNMRLYSLGVAPAARKQGLARRLLAYADLVAVAHRCSRLTLEVCEENWIALSLYLGAGFRPYGRKAEYYEDGCNAVLLKKELAREEAGL